MPFAMPIAVAMRCVQVRDRLECPSVQTKKGKENKIKHLNPGDDILVRVVLIVKLILDYSSNELETTQHMGY